LNFEAMAGSAAGVGDDVRPPGMVAEEPGTKMQGIAAVAGIVAQAINHVVAGAKPDGAAEAKVRELPRPAGSRGRIGVSFGHATASHRTANLSCGEQMRLPFIWNQAK
jgi:hypothetical protein